MVAALVACIASAVAQAEVVIIQPRPDPVISAHIQKIQAPERVLRVAIDQPGGSQSKLQDVSVKGPLADSHITALANAVVAGDKAYWTDAYSWSVHIVGDPQYAIVSVAQFCGFLCAGGASYTYAFKDGRWKFEYVWEQWVS